MRQSTLCLLLNGNTILLAMKKRGFGVGKWNGPGGKFDHEKDKNISDTAIREVKEEIGVEIKNIKKVGLFHFKFVDKEEWNQDVFLFLCKEWLGEPEESEEMLPKWFDLDKIPYENMWPDDIYWMPHILKGEKIEASFLFGEENKILEHNLKIVEDLN